MKLEVDRVEMQGAKLGVTCRRGCQRWSEVRGQGTLQLYHCGAWLMNRTVRNVTRCETLMLGHERGTAAFPVSCLCIHMKVKVKGRNEA